MELNELAGLKDEIVKGVSDTVAKKYDDQIEELHNDLKATNDAIQKMRTGGFGRIDAQDKKEMEPLVANYFQTEICRLDGVTKAWDSATSGGGSELILSEVQTRFVEKLNTYNKLRQYCTVYPDDKGTIYVENAASTAAIMSTRGTAVSEGTPSFSAVNYSTRGRQNWIAVDEKLVRQAPLPVLDYLMIQLAKGLAAGEWKDFITGDGSGDWSGLDTASISTSTPSAHTTIATLDATETVDPYWALGSAYRQGPPIANTFWVTTATYSEQLAALNAAAKEWFKFGDLPAVNSYMGIPILENANCTSSGASEPVAYVGDLSYFYIFDKIGTQLRKAEGGKTLSLGHQVILEAYQETDACVVLADAFKSLTLHA